MQDATDWTLEELVRRTGLALAGSAQAGTYAGAPNGRVRELPDQRLIRWYTSIGLVDRPIGGRGRGARYGVRHLRQLVAVKQLQGQGLPLAEIQARLAGIGDRELAELVPLPPEAPEPAEPVPPVDAFPASPRFWAVEVPIGHTAHRPSIEPLSGVRLAPGVLLVLPTAPGPDDLPALAEAARPLLATLIDRGLIPVSAPLAEPTSGEHR